MYIWNDGWVGPSHCLRTLVSPVCYGQGLPPFIAVPLAPFGPRPALFVQPSLAAWWARSREHGRCSVQPLPKVLYVCSRIIMVLYSVHPFLHSCRMTFLHGRSFLWGAYCPPFAPCAAQDLPSGSPQKIHLWLLKATGDHRRRPVLKLDVILSHIQNISWCIGPTLLHPAF